MQTRTERTGLKPRAVAGAVVAAAAMTLLLAAPARAALQDRDLDGDTVVDAFYDTDLDITWLRDANVNGQMNWYEAEAWAEGFSFAGYSDWRLPTSDTSCSGFNCTGSEMGHLWYVELGNPAGGPMTNTGGFQNLQSYPHYWSSWVDPSNAWEFHMRDGLQIRTYPPFPNYALAVRPGDVAAIPEPQTYALLLLGLTGLTVAVRRRPHWGFGASGGQRVRT